MSRIVVFTSPTKDRKLVPIILMLYVKEKRKKKKIDLDFKSIPSGLSSGMNHSGTEVRISVVERTIL